MAELETRLRDLATALGAGDKELRLLITGGPTTLASLATTNKDSLVAALNELKAALDAAGSAPEVDDDLTNTTNTWSSQKISDQISAAISALTSGAPTALDTLNELAAALNDDPNAISALTSAVASRVRFDAAQTLTAAEKLQARTNIGADITSTEIGDPDTDLVAVYNAAKA